MVDVDLKSSFDTTPHEQLLERVKQTVRDGEVIFLVESFLKQDVLEDMDRWIPRENSSRRGPQPLSG